MKLFLDAHISARRVASQLRARGHDVRAADEERDLDGCNDEQLLGLAAGEERIFVTFDVKDFSVISRRWAEAGQKHTGCAIIVGIDHSEFGVIIAAVEHELHTRPAQADWINRTLYVAKAPSKLD
ncbi:MAG TPA: DUF5615 family PIN-like protein [Solirubrobacteraceae bacterium]